jgi:transporter family-2 protein
MKPEASQLRHVHATQQVVGGFVAALGGVCLAVQGRVNGELGHRMHDGLVAALISFLVGLALLVGGVALTRTGRRGVAELVTGLRVGRLRWFHLIGGFCGAFVVACQGITITAIGVAVFSVAVVAGMVLSSLIVDRAGIGPGDPRPITPPRVAGGALAIVAVVVAVSSKFGNPSGLWLAVLPALAGIFIAWQQAMNGIVRRETDNVVVPTLVNFAAGSVLLLLACAVDVAVRGWPLVPPGDWWLYAGGPLGIGSVMTAVAAVRWIGVLLVGLTSVAGQLVAAVGLDALVPAPGSGLTVTGVAGAVITMMAVGVAAVRMGRWRS